MLITNILSQMQACSIEPHYTVRKKLQRSGDFNQNGKLGNVFDGCENSGYFSFGYRLFIAINFLLLYLENIDIQMGEFRVPRPHASHMSTATEKLKCNSVRSGIDPQRIE